MPAGRASGRPAAAEAARGQGRKREMRSRPRPASSRPDRQHAAGGRLWRAGGAGVGCGSGAGVAAGSSIRARAARASLTSRSIRPATRSWVPAGSVGGRSALGGGASAPSRGTRAPPPPGKAPWAPRPPTGGLRRSPGTHLDRLQLRKRRWRAAAGPRARGSGSEGGGCRRRTAVRGPWRGRSAGRGFTQVAGLYGARKRHRESQGGCLVGVCWLRCRPAPPPRAIGGSNASVVGHRKQLEHLAKAGGRGDGGVHTVQAGPRAEVPVHVRWPRGGLPLLAGRRAPPRGRSWRRGGGARGRITW